jgi:hypothetical protein
MLMASRAKAALAAPAPDTAVPAKTWDDMSKGERMSYNADLALNFTRQLLELKFDPENLKLLGHQKDAALTIISQQIRIEAERLRGPPARSTGASVREFYEHYGDAAASDDG